MAVCVTVMILVIFSAHGTILPFSAIWFNQVKDIEEFHKSTPFNTPSKEGV
jgi:hypothetical protein